MTIDKTQILETQTAVELEEYLENVFPISFKIDGDPCTLDWAATEFSDCDRITVVDQDGTRYRLEINVLLHELPR